jgi:cell division protein FtsB
MSVSYYDDYKQPGQGGFWHVLNRLLTIFIVFAVIALIICLFVPQVRKQQDLARQADDLKSQIETQKAILTLRNRQVDLLKNDPGYVEILARGKLDMMKEGETIFRIEPQASPSAKPAKHTH